MHWRCNLRTKRPFNILTAVSISCRARRQPAAEPPTSVQKHLKIAPMPEVDDLIDQMVVTTGLLFLFYLLMKATQPSVVDANSEREIEIEV